jgi:cysteine desulfurase
MASAVARARNEHPERAPRILISAIEHDSVTSAAEEFAAQGVLIETIPVTPAGVVDLAALAMLLETPTDLVVVMHANNETGVIQPVEEVSALCQAKGALYLCDAVQTLGKLPLDLTKLGASYVTFSGHKLGAPKGVGFLVVTAKGRVLYPLIYGKQQKGLRGGTENTLGIAILGRLIHALRKGDVCHSAELGAMHQRFEAELKSRIPGLIVHGEGAPRLPNTSFIGFEGVEGDGVLLNLDLAGVAASSGSACSSGSIDPSSTLLAMGCDAKLARSSVRFSSGFITPWEDFEEVIEVLPPIVERIRKAAASRKAPPRSSVSLEVSS